MTPVTEVPKPERGLNRFDYVKYDAEAAELQLAFKTDVCELEAKLAAITPNKGRSISLALTALEEFYMWVGKAIRDAQVERNGYAQLDEGRAKS